ncbi:RHS repeat-associated core domain-containing protein [Neptuniibacter sp. QD34_54]|uniref:RHS repeat-associated core domain-containing protein n=1 Tax=Neptuniibacter sp. QD34_54 TaxID=3398208 RepID=UPI0039F4EF21
MPTLSKRLPSSNVVKSIAEPQKPTAATSLLKSVSIGALLTAAALQPALATPASTDAVGYIDGKLDISDGAARYSIPIAVPPGVAGMEPMFSLNYSSQTGNGLLGMGWNLTGVSLVHRCGSTLAQDGKNRKVKLDNSDNYCLDGKRLIPVSGTNGQDGTEYRTEVETFSKIVSYGSAGNGPAWFKVWTKAGQIMEFGNTADSRIEAQGKSTVLNYAVNKISDTSVSGNSINFKYTEINANSEFVPDYISYGPNGQNKVEFSYSDISDLPATTLAGSKLKSSKRLSKIETFANNQAVQNWTFTFEAQTDRPDKLTALKLCAADGSCLPETTIGWDKFKPITNSKKDSYAIDFNGDGIKDEYRIASAGESKAKLYVRYQNASGTAPESLVISNIPKVGTPYQQYPWSPTVTVYSMPEVALGDYNGDGLTDLSFSSSANYFSTGLGFTKYSSEALYGWRKQGAYDFNGDGYDDAYLVSLDLLTCDTPKIAIGKSNGGLTPQKTGRDGSSGWNIYGAYPQGSCYDTYPNGFTNPVRIVQNGKTLHIKDINNDGIPDLAPSSGHIFLGSKDGFSYFTSVSAYANHSKTKLDMVTSITNNTTTSWAYASILDSSVYPNQNESNSYPEKELRGTYLVKTVTSDNGVGGTRETTYQYGGAKVNELGRGYLGFAWIEETDQSTGTKVRTEYNQSFPYVGMVTKTETFLADGTLINKAESQHASLTSHNGRVFAPYITDSVEQSYERDGSLVSTKNIQNAQYDGSGNVGWIKEITTAGGEAYSKITVNTYDNDTAKWHLGRLKKVSVTHEHADGSTKVRNSAFEYDPTTGFLTKEIIEPGTTMEVATTTTYDDYGNKTAVSTTAASETVARSASTQFDANGQFPISSSNALGHSDSKVTDGRYGVLTSQTGPNGLTTTWEYDSFGNQTKEIRADGTTSTVTRHWIGSGQCAHAPAGATYCVVSQTDGSAPAEVYYDSLNRKLRTVTIGFNAQPVYKDTVYNSLGQVEKVSRAYYADALQLYWATSTFDDMGRLIKAEEPGVNGTISAVSTQYNGLTTVAINAKGHAKTTITNALGKVISVQEPEGASISYQYDALGNLIQTTDSAGNVVTIEYDLLGRKTSMNDPDMGVWSYDYNGYGELIKQTDAKGQISEMQYDVLGRMTQRTEPEGISTWLYDTAANGIGKLAKVTGADGYQKTFVYDSLGRLQDATTEADSKVLTISTEYDQYSRLKKLVRPQGFVTENLYTAEGYLQAVRGLRGQIDDYTVTHLETLLETAIRDAQELQAEAYNTLLVADGFIAAANAYRDQLDSTQAADLPNLPVAFNAGDSFTLLEGLDGSQYLKLEDSRTESERIILIHGDVVTPILLPSYYILKIDGAKLATVATSFSDKTLENSLVATNGKVHITDDNSDGALELLVLNGQAIDNLTAIAAEVDEAAQLLLMDVQALMDASDILLNVAETAYREALLAGYWAPGSNDEYYNDYQSLIQDQNYVTFWQAKERDAEGRLARELHGNGLSSVYNYDPSNGLLLRQQTAFANFAKLRDLEYQYDELNNVTQRADLVAEVEESFTYDALDRLKTSTVVSTTVGENLTETKTYAYDTLGNITHKSDVGDYQYNSHRPHAVTAAGGNTYSYDANGNMTSGAGRTLTWSSFNKPVTMAKDGKTVNFTYAPDRARYLKEGSDGTKTLYLDKLYELITKGQEVTHKQFIYAGSSLVAVHVSGLDHNGSAIPVQTRYMHKDNLGSVDAITDGVGNVVERMSFDPFGSRRQSNWREAEVGINLIPVFTNRGFTGHEHIDEMDLIHMNGRVYDPTLGRFLSADPHIQSPHNTQSYNRYSYVMNNPMKYADPSGYFFKGLFKAIGGIFDGFIKLAKSVFENQVFRMVAGIAVGVFVGGWAIAAFESTIIGGAIGGFAGGFVSSGGDIKASIIGGLTGAAAGYIGGLDKLETFGKAMAHGVVGGVSSKLQGGKFASGFISSAFAKSISGHVKTWADGNYFKGAVAMAMVGGTASVLGGGKFGNGAMTSAIQYLFNEVAKERKFDAMLKKLEEISEAEKLAGIHSAEYGAVASLSLLNEKFKLYSDLRVDSLSANEQNTLHRLITGEPDSTLFSQNKIMRDGAVLALEVKYRKSALFDTWSSIAGTGKGLTQAMANQALGALGVSRVGITLYNVADTVLSSQ